MKAVLNYVASINYHCTQGTEAWFSARAGHITASNFESVCTLAGGLTAQQQAYVDAKRAGCSDAQAMAMAGYKAAPRADGITRALNGERVGDFSDSAKNYAFRLAVERVSKSPLDADGFNMWQAERGIILEADARRIHCNRTGLIVEPVGFVGTTDGKFGCSADGFIDEDAGAEYKCYLDPVKLRAILLERNVSAVRFQCQGNMWLTGRLWWDFALYCPALASIGLELQLFRIERDEAFISDMVPKLQAFDQFVCGYEQQLRVEGMRAMAANTEDFPILLRADEAVAA
jgi:hypothetical protein